MKNSRYQNQLRTLSRVLLALVAMVALAGGALAQGDTQPAQPAQPTTPTPRVTPPRAQANFDFQLQPTIDTLVADGESETTLVAFLSDANGNPFEDEQIRFTLRSGIGFLSAPGVGTDVTGSAGSAAAEGGTPAPSQSLESNIAVDGISIGNGIYVARFRAGSVPGDARVGAIWLSAPDTPLPETETSIRLVTADRLRVEVDDNVLLADGQDEATVVAYVLNTLNRPVDNANVTFRIISGPGNLVADGGENGRYWTTYRAGTAPGNVVIEAALPTISNPIRQTVQIKTVEAVGLEASVFPETVARVPSGSSVDIENTSTVLVAVRDGDGDLVRGLGPRDLVAQVVSGPGLISDGQEIDIPGGNSSGSGVYEFTFTATETTGESIVRVTNLASPGNPFAEVTIKVVTQVRAGIAEDLRIETYFDEPFYTSGQDEALIILTAADSEGNAVSGLDPDFLITGGRGTLSGQVEELDNLGDTDGTGVYITMLTSGTANSPVTTQIRSIVSNFDGSVVTHQVDIAGTPLLAPRVVVFPDRVPAGAISNAVVDVYDFDAETLDTSGPRYRVDILAGPGEVIQPATNSGSSPDLVADDNIHSALFEVNAGAAASQDIDFTVIDTAVAGFPSARPQVKLGATTQLNPIAFPSVANRGDLVQVVVMARDEFGLPAVNHDLVLTIVSGSGEVEGQGRLFDDGGVVMGFTDAYANDGMYVGAFRASAIATGNVTLRITDTTPPEQPFQEVRVTVR